MKNHTEYLWFNTKKQREYINISHEVEEIVRKSGVKEGMVLVSAMHITAAVYVNDAEDGLIQDIDEWLEKLAPFNLKYRHHRTGETNGDAHLKSLLMHHEVIIPITEGKLDFGPWQQVYYAEFDGQRKKRPSVRKLLHLLEYAAFLAFSTILFLLPLSLVQAMGRACGRFAFSVVRFRKEVTVNNLIRAFPDYPMERILEIAVGAYESLGVSLFELIWVSRMNRESIRRLVHLENPEEIRQVVARGKGLILATAHFGNWEMCAQSFVAELGIPLHVVVKPQSNMFIDRHINRRRERLGNKAIPMAQAVREISKALREGQAVGIVGDQSAAKESLWVEFFGRKVPTHPGTAVFALKNGSPLMLGFAIRQPDGRYTLRFDEVAADDIPDYSPANVEELTRRHVQLTEATIRKYPQQYMWMHRRWKHASADETVTSAKLSA